MSSLIPVLLLTASTLTQAPPSTFDTLGGGVQSLYQSIRRNIVAAAELMPEAHYGFRPSPDVRTFGQLVGHLANTQYNFCAPARELPNPSRVNHENHPSKAALVQALKDAVAFCDPVYTGLTDATLSAPAAWGPTKITKGYALVFNVAHDNEHYGNMVTYMRMKGLVPPSSAPTPR